MTEVLTYEALKAERDAQQKRADALAVENQALKARAVTVPAKVYVKDMRCNVVRWAQVVDALSEAGVAFVRDDGELIAGTRETPATDAALAAIQAQAIEDAVTQILSVDTIASTAVISHLLRTYATELREAK
ncbi:hypothetical protein P9A10_16565 [Serratia marcescens]|uniref:hypothetical protein n=1 Tax=Serratia marcescens TaxID=615 RepID=UPI0032049693